ncbi:hypothetical protein A5823_002843 [Enterococcus faecalis]|uniref:hypothetical protein n=1 Tax=Enterococcus faecalis TaxID=1351 RepID=UPI000A3461CB|nr:hypothetical protein [Enterococcus faecalis]OTP25087.1 hypothetical protein A5823_002843 [Enterococcus faecalis]
MGFNVGFDKSLFAKEPFMDEEMNSLVTGVGIDFLFDKDFEHSKDVPESLSDMLTVSYDHEKGEFLFKEDEHVTVFNSFSIIGYTIYVPDEQYFKGVPTSIPVEVEKERFGCFIKKYKNKFETTESLQTLSFIKEEFEYSDKPIISLMPPYQFYPTVCLNKQEMIKSRVQEEVKDFPCYSIDCITVQQTESIYLLGYIPSDKAHSFLFYDDSKEKVLAVTETQHEFWNKYTKGD